MPDAELPHAVIESVDLSDSSREKRLVETFVDLAGSMVTDFDLIEFLHQVANHSVNMLGADAAGLMLADNRGVLRVLTSTSEQMRVLELFELQSAEGPCLECFRTGLPVVNVDLAEAKSRWPLFTAEANDAGFASVHALPLRTTGTVIGVINLFCSDAVMLEPSDVVVGQALADMAVIGLLARHTGRDDEVVAEHLQAAINGRILVEQAKGVLAERLGISMDEGLRLLVHYAGIRGARVAAVAAAVVDGSIPATSLPDGLPASEPADPSRLEH